MGVVTDLYGTNREFGITKEKVVKTMVIKGVQTFFESDQKYDFECMTEAPPGIEKICKQIQ